MSAESIGDVVMGATLLTLEQANELPQSILRSDGRWWLKTPGFTKSTVTQVYKEGVVDGLGINVEMCSVGIRPILLIKPDTERLGPLRFNRKLNLYRKDGTPVSFIYIGTNADGQGMLMTENCIDKGQFRMDWKSGNANDYKKSDAKQKVDEFGELMKECTLEQDKPQQAPSYPDTVKEENDGTSRRGMKKYRHFRKSA